MRGPISVVRREASGRSDTQAEPDLAAPVIGRHDQAPGPGVRIKDQGVFLHTAVGRVVAGPSRWASVRSGLTESATELATVRFQGRSSAEGSPLRRRCPSRSPKVALMIVTR